jgi:hypothetical protein
VAGVVVSVGIATSCCQHTPGLVGVHRPKVPADPGRLSPAG